jgi:hypothetical protein
MWLLASGAKESFRQMRLGEKERIFKAVLRKIATHMRTKMRETSRSSIWATEKREIIVHHSLLGGMQQESEIYVPYLETFSSNVMFRILNV